MVFPAHFTGSTDVVSCSVHGVRDPATAAMHIVLGKPPPYIYYTVDKIILRIYLIHCYKVFKSILYWLCETLISLANN